LFFRNSPENKKILDVLWEKEKVIKVFLFLQSSYWALNYLQQASYAVLKVSKNCA